MSSILAQATNTTYATVAVWYDKTSVSWCDEKKYEVMRWPAVCKEFAKRPRNSEATDGFNGNRVTPLWIL